MKSLMRAVLMSLLVVPVVACGGDKDTATPVLSMPVGSGALPELPIVTIACPNRYAYGLEHGALGRAIVASMREVGIDTPRLKRMTAALALERHVQVLRGRPVLHVWGMLDPVDPQPSGKRLLAALRPTRSVPIPAGHGSLLLFRRKIAHEMRAFLGAGPIGERLPAIRA